MIPPVLITITTGQFNDAIREAERRGQVEALRAYADVVEAGPRLTRTEEVTDIRNRADRIERGETP